MAYMTVDQILRQIHYRYEGDTDYLEFEDEETQLRVAHLKDGLREWVNRFPEYREVFADLVSAENGDKVTTGGVTVYDCPINLVRPASRVKVGSTYLDYIDPSAKMLRLEANANDPWYTITGRPGALKLIINPAPAGGNAIDYDYWRDVSMPETTTDVVEISRPFFVVYYVLNQIYEEDDPDRARLYEAKMDEEERRERVALAKNSGSSNRLTIYGAGFGDRTSPNLIR